MNTRKNDSRAQLNANRPRTFSISLSWPSSALMPNRSSGRAWQWSHADKVAYQQEAYFLARQEINRTGYEVGPGAVWRLTLTFCPPDGRSRNLDSLHIALKPAVDGIASALGVDDERFVEHAQAWGTQHMNGRVVVTLTEVVGAHHANLTRKMEVA